MKPILVFLHGVGDGDPKAAWKTALNTSLQAAGYGSLDDVDVIAPKYSHALKGSDDDRDVPPIAHKRLSKSDAQAHRREFEQRIAGLEYRLGPQQFGTGWIGAPVVVEAGLHIPSNLTQAANYLGNEKIRAQVLKKILSELPQSGKIVLIGHSLGSVIAADLLLRLPKEVYVEGFVTIGSPLAHGSFNIDSVRKNLDEAPNNLGWWVNFWHASDPVASHRGLSSQFPWLLDYCVGKTPTHKAHAAVLYLSHRQVGEAVGYALFGSLSKELVQINSDLDVSMTETEQITFLALRYAYLLEEALKNDPKTPSDLLDRFTGARRRVQADAIRDMRIWREEQGMSRHLPNQLEQLSFDASDLDESAPIPSFPKPLTKEQAVVLLVAISSQNIVSPFEIELPKDKAEKALIELCVELQVGGKFGSDVLKAAQEAQEAIRGRRGFNWQKWGALGAGTAALIALAASVAIVVAPIGLAGAALVTTALASFGPGGMIGGLITAGSLVGAGTGGIAYGLASSSTSAATTAEVVERLLAVEILRKYQKIESDPTIWNTLVETEIKVRREYERMDEFSDRKAPGLAELKAKIDTMATAISFLRDAGLEPSADLELCSD